MMKPLPKLHTWQWVIIGLVLAFMLDWFIQRPDSRARELNAVIEQKASDHLRNYPYRFRVIRVEGSTAYLSTPRNVSVPAFRFLAIIHPDVDVKNANNPAFIAAEKSLAAAQTEARDLVQAQAGIKAVRWELDKNWLSAHGIDVPADH